MKDLVFKAQLVEHLIKMQHTAIANVRKTMEGAQEEANKYGVPKDQYDGFKDQQMRRKNMFAKQLNTAMKNLELLNNLDLKQLHNSVGFGTLVQTESAVYFVAIGIGIIEFQGEDVAVISMLVPLFHAMKGKKKGDDFSFNDEHHTIIQLI